MRKNIIAILALVFLFLSAHIAEADEPEFDTASVIVAAGPAVNAIGLFSDEPSFDIPGIAEVENLDITSPSNISLFNAAGPKIFKLTLENPGEENVLEMVDKLNALPYVEYAEPNYTYQLLDYPDDTYYSYQYALEKINAPAVWDMNIDCSGVTAAVIDSGVIIDHPDLKDNIWTNPGEIPDNGIDDDENGFTDDVHGWDFGDGDNTVEDVNDNNAKKGHGTHVSGIISAVTNNGTGVASLARNAKIMPLRVYNSSGSASFDSIYKAMQYAHMMGASIVNNSYGASKDSDAMRSAIQQFDDMLFVAAAGNNGNNIDAKAMYPASYDFDNVLSVANTDKNDTLSSTSNYGVESVDIAAPGVSITSTHLYNGYKDLSGTSMACPMTVSAAVVVKAAHPELTPAQIAERIISSVDKIDGLTGKVKSGGRLNAYAAVVSVTAARDGGHVTVKLDIPGKSDDDVQLFAAMRGGGSVQGIIAPEVKNMTAEFEAPADASDIRLYIWDKNMRPYTAAVDVPPENESGSDTIE